jgi:predicted small lipoprotein YifL
MNIKNLFALNILAATLAACGGGGDINLNPSNSVTDSNNPVNNTTNNNAASSSSAAANLCATYELAGQKFSGVMSGNNCNYSVSFVSDSRPLTVDLYIPALPNGGVHIFDDSLFMGNDVDANAAAAGVLVPQQGQGPSLTIEAGSKLAFSNPEDYVRIARGSKIIAEGTKTAPIIFSAKQDLIGGTATEADRGLWGGVQILGNGLTNKCSTDHVNCHILSEGRPGTYGGNNNAESSGVLKYVVIKHAGYEVVDGNELNGLTLYSVGSGTIIDYVQTYSVADDGFEFFGGAVNAKHIVAVNAADDSFDFTDGYQGNIQFALAMHTSGANRCIEGDNTGENRKDDFLPISHPRFSNVTCITTGIKQGQGTTPSGKGDSEGPLLREGTQFEIYNSIITSGATGNASQECFELDDTEGYEGSNAAIVGISNVQSTVIACTESVKTTHWKDHHDNDSFNAKTWFTTATGNTNNVVMDSASAAGTLPVSVIKDLATNPLAYITAPAFSDGNLMTFNVPVVDVTKLSKMPSTTTPPVAGSNTFFDSVDFIGAVSESNDWVSGWTVGLNK